MTGTSDLPYDDIKKNDSGDYAPFDIIVDAKGYRHGDEENLFLWLTGSQPQ